MSAKWMGLVWELVLTPAKREVLLAMADHADHEGRNIKASIPLIAWKTDYSERETQRIVAALLTDKLVYVQHAFKGKANVYGLDFSHAAKKPPFVRKSVGRPRKTGDTLTGDKSKTPDKMAGDNGKTPDKTPDMPSAKVSDDPLDPLKDSLSVSRAREQFKVFIPTSLAGKVDVLTFQAACNAIFYAYLDALALPQVNRKPVALPEIIWEAHRDAAMGLAAAGITPDQVRDYVLHEYIAPGKHFWNEIDNPLPLKNVAKGINGYLQRKARQAAKAVPAAPIAKAPIGTSVPPAMPLKSAFAPKNVDPAAFERVLASLPELPIPEYMPEHPDRVELWKNVGRQGTAMARAAAAAESAAASISETAKE